MLKISAEKKKMKLLAYYCELFKKKKFIQKKILCYCISVQFKHLFFLFEQKKKSGEQKRLGNGYLKKPNGKPKKILERRGQTFEKKKKCLESAIYLNSSLILFFFHL